MRRLSIPPDSVVYPPQNQGSIRPDLVVVGHDGKVRAWIEIELGPENGEQMAAYRKQLVEPVKSIVGPKEAEGDLSLSELADVVDVSLASVFDQQQRQGSAVFVSLVRSLAGTTSSWSYAAPAPQVLVDPLVAGLAAGARAEARGREAARAARAAPPDHHHAGGLDAPGVRQRNGEKSVSVMWCQSLGSGRVRVPSLEHLRKHRAAGAAEAYADWMLRAAGADLRAIPDGRSVGVDQQELIDRLPDLLALLRGFVG